MTTPDLDLVVFGATGFTGRQAAAYLAEHAPADLRWALAGRSADKLAAVRDGLGPDHADRELIIADSHDAAAIDAMAARTRVVLTTVGPFAAYGSELFGACARHGTDYVDITGETPWVADMIAKWEKTAQDSGARLIPFCGFDSVPSDMGAWMMVDWIRREWDQPTLQVESVFKMKGGVNGGTMASAVGMMERGETRRMGDPYLLNPPGSRPDKTRPGDRDPMAAHFDERLGGWTAPFFMGPVNSRVVRRSAALFAAQDHPYGPDFTYRERMWAGRGLSGRATATSLTGGQGVFAWLGSKDWGPKLVSRLAPDPGEGPSEATMDAGFFQTELLAEAGDGRQVAGVIHSQGDPGNRSTVRMLCEAALCLAVDGDALPQQGGVRTPATALGGRYLERLRASGMRWEVTGPVDAG